MNIKPGKKSSFIHRKVKWVFFLMVIIGLPVFVYTVSALPEQPPLCSVPSECVTASP